MRTQFIIDADVPEDREEEMRRNLGKLVGVIAVVPVTDAPDRHLPDDVLTSLDTIEQSLGELLYLRRVVESIKAANPALLETHAKLVAEQMGVDRRPPAGDTIAGRYLLALRHMAKDHTPDSVAAATWFGVPSLCRALEISEAQEADLRARLRIAGFVQDTTTSGANPLVRLTEEGWTAAEALEH